MSAFWFLHPGKDLLVRHIEGASLPAWQRRRLDNHLEKCASCRQAADQYVADLSILDGALPLDWLEEEGQQTQGWQDVLARAPHLAAIDPASMHAPALQRQLAVFLGPGIAQSVSDNPERADLILVRLLGRRAAREIAQRCAA